MPNTLPSTHTVLCLLPEERWRLDELEAALASRGADLWVRCCDPTLESASTLLNDSLARGITAVLYCDTLDRLAHLGQTDDVTEFLQAMREGGYPVVRERFALGGPFGDEAMTTTPAEQLVQLLVSPWTATP